MEHEMVLRFAWEDDERRAKQEREEAEKKGHGEQAQILEKELTPAATPAARSSARVRARRVLGLAAAQEEQCWQAELLWAWRRTAVEMRHGRVLAEVAAEARKEVVEVR